MAILVKLIKLIMLCPNFKDWIKNGSNEKEREKRIERERDSERVKENEMSWRAAASTGIRRLINPFQAAQQRHTAKEREGARE